MRARRALPVRLVDHPGDGRIAAYGFTQATPLSTASGFRIGSVGENESREMSRKMDDLLRLTRLRLQG